MKAMQARTNKTLGRIFSALTVQADNALYTVEHTEDANADPRTAILRDFVARMKAANQL